MTKYRTLDHPMMPMIAWDPARPAEWINDHIAMVHGTSNSYVIIGDDGDVVINTTTDVQGPGARKKLEALLGRPLKVSKLIFTQSHPDHTGGWQEFAGPDTEILVQREFTRICAERKLLGPFFTKRNARVLAALIPPENKGTAWFNTPDPEPLTIFSDDYEFTFSGRRYCLMSMPSGETVDGLAVWLPDEKTVFIGNWAGAIYGALPNFYTARGDRDRSVTRWLEDCESLLDLNADVLVSGHEQPIYGADAIQRHFRKLYDAVAYIHDETVEGMNQHLDLSTILQKIELPEHLRTAPGRGPAHWYARSVWEEYAGWFRQERTSELYATPQSAIWPEIVEAAGGGEAVAGMAKAHLDAGRSERALHLIEMAVAAQPTSRIIREVELAVYEDLADRTEGKIFDQLGWLEGKIIDTKAALSSAE